MPRFYIPLENLVKPIVEHNIKTPKFLNLDAAQGFFKFCHSCSRMLWIACRRTSHHIDDCKPARSCPSHDLKFEVGVSSDITQVLISICKSLIVNNALPIKQTHTSGQDVFIDTRNKQTSSLMIRDIFCKFCKSRIGDDVKSFFSRHGLSIAVECLVILRFEALKFHAFFDSLFDAFFGTRIHLCKKFFVSFSDIINNLTLRHIFPRSELEIIAID